MFRWLMMGVGGLAICACSGHSAHQVPANTQDAGSMLDAGTRLAAPPRVLNTGAACESATDCQGESPTCMTELMVPGGGGAAPPGVGAPMGTPNLPSEIRFPGGYCTAMCNASDQCAGTAECGLTELYKDLQPILAQTGAQIPSIDPSQIPSQCLRLCGSDAVCREGYACQTLIEAVGLAGQLPIPRGLLARYCLPRSQPSDAGVTLDAGMDAALPPDAGETSDDAGLSDAGE